MLRYINLYKKFRCKKENMSNILEIQRLLEFIRQGDNFSPFETSFLTVGIIGYWLEVHGKLAEEDDTKLYFDEIVQNISSSVVLKNVFVIKISDEVMNQARTDEKTFNLIRLLLLIDPDLKTFIEKLKILSIDSSSSTDFGKKAEMVVDVVIKLSSGEKAEIILDSDLAKSLFDLSILAQTGQDVSEAPILVGAHLQRHSDTNQDIDSGVNLPEPLINSLTQEQILKFHGVLTNLKKWIIDQGIHSGVNFSVLFEKLSYLVAQDSKVMDNQVMNEVVSLALLCANNMMTDSLAKKVDELDAILKDFLPADVPIILSIVTKYISSIITDLKTKTDDQRDTRIQKLVNTSAELNSALTHFNSERADNMDSDIWAQIVNRSNLGKLLNIILFTEKSSYMSTASNDCTNVLNSFSEIVREYLLLLPIAQLQQLILLRDIVIDSEQLGVLFVIRPDLLKSDCLYNDRQVKFTSLLLFTKNFSGSKELFLFLRLGGYDTDLDLAKQIYEDGFWYNCSHFFSNQIIEEISYLDFQQTRLPVIEKFFGLTKTLEEAEEPIKAIDLAIQLERQIDLSNLISRWSKEVGSGDKLRQITDKILDILDSNLDAKTKSDFINQLNRVFKDSLLLFYDLDKLELVIERQKREINDSGFKYLRKVLIGIYCSQDTHEMAIRACDAFYKGLINDKSFEWLIKKISKSFQPAILQDLEGEQVLRFIRSLIVLYNGRILSQEASYALQDLINNPSFSIPLIAQNVEIPVFND